MDAKKRPLTSAEKIAFLKSTDLFKEISVEKLFQIAASLVVQNFKAGEIIISQGDAGDSMFMIIDGKVSVEVENSLGKSALMATLEAGKSFGEMSLLDSRPRSATVKAIEDCKCLKLEGEELKRLATGDPEMALELAATLSRRLRATMGQDNLH